MRPQTQAFLGFLTAIVFSAAYAGQKSTPDPTASNPPGAQAEIYRVETLAQGLEYPWSLAFLPEGGMLVTERPGRLRVVSADRRVLTDPVAGLPLVLDEAYSQLLDLALAPDFERSRRLFFSFICGSAKAHGLCLASAVFPRDGGERPVLESIETLFKAEPMLDGSRQYGGRMAFLPDGTLTLTVGDFYDYREKSQGLSNHLGKVIRLNQDGTVPADNPFLKTENARPEIYSLGHRNPLGILWHAPSQQLLLHENGAQGGDELNAVKPGANYGWPIVSYGVEYSGDQISPYSSLPAFQDPLLHWTPSIAPSGMSYYDAELFPAWRGSILVSALKGMGVHRITLSEQGANDVETLFTELNARFRDVQPGPEGALYLLTDSHEGKLLRVSRAD